MSVPVCPICSKPQTPLSIKHATPEHPICMQNYECKRCFHMTITIPPCNEQHARQARKKRKP